VEVAVPLSYRGLVISAEWAVDVGGEQLLGLRARYSLPGHAACCSEIASTALEALRERLPWCW